jgi:hypothetical protein
MMILQPSVFFRVEANGSDKGDASDLEGNH